MQNKTIILLLCVLLPVLSWAGAPAVKSDHPDTYTVVRGDTLWDISARFLREPWRWPEIWEVNPQIDNPHLIYPGDVISLVYRDGRPVLAVDRDAGSRYVRLSPEVRSYPRDEAIPAIPMEYLQPFLSRPLVVTEREMDAWPYVVSSADQRMIAGSGMKIYVRGLSEDNRQRYSIYRKGPAYVMPDDVQKQRRTLTTHTKYSDRRVAGEVLGYQALYVGEARIERGGDPATAMITSSEREVLVGDRLIPESPQGRSGDFIPSTPAAEIDGRIISVIDGVSEVGNYQIVVVSAGIEQGLESGDVLAVHQTGKMVRDTVAAEMRAAASKEDRLEFKYEDVSPVDSLLSNIANDLRDTKRDFDSYMGYFGQPQRKAELVELPAEYAGVVLVFRTFDKLSYALVMDTERPIHIYDRVTNP